MNQVSFRARENHSCSGSLCCEIKSDLKLYPLGKGVMDGPLKFLPARKILPLLDLLAKFKRVLACSCSPNFCSCSHARFLVSIGLNFVNPSCLG